MEKLSASQVRMISDIGKYGAAFSGSDFLAPTFYKLKGSLGGWNYYRSRMDAFNKIQYLAKERTDNVTAAGVITFTTNDFETAGINCDFYFPYSNYIIPVSYNAIKQIGIENMPLYGIVQFTKKDGTGPYYAVFDKRYFGISATKKTVSAEQKQAAEAFYRNLELIKAQYNTLVTFTNELSQKEFNPVTQSLLNKAMVRKDALRSQISQIKGVNITESATGIGIAIIPIIIIISVIGAGAWILSTWLTEKEKTDRILSAFNHQQWLTIEQKNIMDQYKAGKISAEVAKQALANIGIAMETAGKVAEESSKDDKGLLGNIGEIIKWAAIGFIGYQIVKRA